MSKAKEGAILRAIVRQIQHLHSERPPAPMVVNLEPSPLPLWQQREIQAERDPPLTEKEWRQEVLRQNSARRKRD